MNLYYNLHLNQVSTPITVLIYKRIFLVQIFSLRAEFVRKMDFHICYTKSVRRLDMQMYGTRKRRGLALPGCTRVRLSARAEVPEWPLSGSNTRQISENVSMDQ